VGRRLLIPSSRRANARRRGAAASHGGCGGSRAASEFPYDAHRHWLHNAVASAGLAALVAATAWGVANVSVWWLPAYLALMAVIFVAPAKPHRSRSTKGPTEGSFGSAAVDPVGAARADRSEGPVTSHLTSAWDAGMHVGSCTAAAPECGSVPAAIGGARSRRTRIRARKAARPAAEVMPELSAVSWISVGPGKFVRADNANSDIARDQAHGKTEMADEIGPCDASALVTPVPAASARKMAQHEPFSQHAVNPGAMAMALASEDGVAGTLSEEYGTAPSACELLPQDSFSSERLHSGGAEASVDLTSDLEFGKEPDSDYIAELTDGASLGVTRPDPDRWHRWKPRVQTVWLARGVARTISGPGVPHGRRGVRAYRELRIARRSARKANGRLEQATRRAFERVAHVQCILRARSPPVACFVPLGRPIISEAWYLVRAPTSFERSGTQPAGSTGLGIRTYSGENPCGVRS
jgi:hypothetical protein